MDEESHEVKHVAPKAAKKTNRGKPRKAVQPAEEAQPPRIDMAVEQAQASYEWSPSTSASTTDDAPRKTSRGRPRREAPISGTPDEMGIVKTPDDNGSSQQDNDDVPESYRASPSDAPQENAGSEEQRDRQGEPEGQQSGHPQGQDQQGRDNNRGGQQNGWRDRRFNNRGGNNRPGGRFDRFNNRGGQQPRGGSGNNFAHHGQGQNGGQRYDGGNKRFDRQQRGNPNNRGDQEQAQRASMAAATPREESVRNEWNEPLPQWEIFNDYNALEAMAQQVAPKGEVYDYSALLGLGGLELVEKAKALGVAWEGAAHRDKLLAKILEVATAAGYAVHAEGVVDKLGEETIIVFETENYRVRSLSPYLPKVLAERYGIKRGTQLKVQIQAPREGSKMAIALKVLSIAGEAPEKNLAVTPFEELTPYYPTKRILLETHPDVKWDNFSMRILDLLTPIGFGQRGLIVAPPRTGKTILMQGIAHAITENHPEAHLMVLLVDERPEEVTDFRRNIKGEVISSTFDEVAQSHVHAAEVVIEKARRMVERGAHVVILLDSITRLARAYNAMTGNTGKIMSGGVESNALQKPKRFFGSARNIENGGSLTILGTALVETGSKMDEVIFEEFKGTGNMEVHLDRGLVDKRLFPAIAIDRSGTRKEELLYHPDETQKIYGLRRAMKGVTPLEGMEMLLTRVKKTKTNIEFLMGLSR